MKPAPSSSKAAILPLTIHSPDVGVNTLVIIFKIVDFPLPFLPMMPRISPLFTLKETSFKAANSVCLDLRENKASFNRSLGLLYKL